MPKTFKSIKIKKTKWNNDSRVANEFDYNQSFRLNSTSMFDQNNNAKTNRSGKKNSISPTKNIHKKSRSKESQKEGGTIDNNAMRNKTRNIKVKSIDSSSKSKARNNRTFTANAPDKKSVQIYRRKMKSPMNLLRALGIYK